MVPWKENWEVSIPHILLQIIQVPSLRWSHKFGIRYYYRFLECSKQITYKIVINTKKSVQFKGLLSSDFSDIIMHKHELKSM
jgi:hypothetical protein